MNKTPAEAAVLVDELKAAITEPECNVVICVPFTDLPVALEKCAGTPIKVGAQNCHFETSGAFTGEISPVMLKEMGVVARTAGYERLDDAAGAFARMPGFRPAPVPYAGPEPAVEEFVLLCGLSDAQVNEFLARSREAGCVVGPKALLTKTNRAWPLVRLMDAVAAEHAQMGGGGDSGAD